MTVTVDAMVGGAMWIRCGYDVDTLWIRCEDGVLKSFLIGGETPKWPK
jgi:hypothetical protein